jgi:hypothetical protein
LVAKHVITTGQEPPPTLIDRYLADAFLDVRAYGQWLRLRQDQELGPQDTFAELARASALAKSASLDDLAAKLEARAAQVAGSATLGPYRA